MAGGQPNAHSIGLPPWSQVTVQPSATHVHVPGFYFNWSLKLKCANAVNATLCSEEQDAR